MVTDIDGEGKSAGDFMMNGRAKITTPANAVTHNAHALERVAAAAQSVIDSGQLPERVDGYRIVTESGTEFYGWPNGGHASSN